jgi:hypothetical protein
MHKVNANLPTQQSVFAKDDFLELTSKICPIGYPWNGCTLMDGHGTSAVYVELALLIFRLQLLRIVAGSNSMSNVPKPKSESNAETKLLPEIHLQSPENNGRIYGQVQVQEGGERCQHG